MAKLRHARRSSWLKAVGVISVFVALAGWALASPVGATPDEDFHLTSIWCSHGISALCQPGTSSTTRTVPAPLLQDSCYAFDEGKSAACQQQQSAPGTTVLTHRGNFYQNLYPPVYYWVAGLFVGDDISHSVITIRIVNIILYIGLITALYLALPFGLRRPLVGSAIVTAVPFGVFLVASVNPSGWAILSATTVLVSMVGFLRAEQRRRKIALGILAALSLLVGAGARTDAATYGCLAIGTAVVLAVKFRWRSLRDVALPAGLVVVAGLLFLSGSQSSSADPGATTTAGQNHSLGRLVLLVLNVPDLWVGGFGTWGLGWLDTPLLPIVWVAAGGVYAAVLFAALGAPGRRQLAAVGIFASAAIAVPTYILYLSGYQVGDFVQPRYILPLLTLLVATAMVRLDGAAFQLTNVQRWAIVGALTVANALAMHMNIRRYVSGSGDPWTDGFGWNLDRNIQWWWSIPIPPNAVWIVSSIAFGVGALLLTREFTSRDPAQGHPGSASDSELLAPSHDVDRRPRLDEGRHRAIVAAHAAAIAEGP
jgi:hypothetical protein